MKILSRFLYGLCLVLFADTSVFAQQANLYFHHFDKNSGVPQTVCNSIYKDSRGFVWITTTSGLYRFDGASFTDVFKNNELLKSHALKDIKEDKTGIFWLTKNDDELVRFDPYKNSVEIISLRPYINTYQIQVKGLSILHIDEYNRLWIGVNGNAIFCYDIKSKTTTSVIPPVDPSVLVCAFFDKNDISHMAVYKITMGSTVIQRGTFTQANNVHWQSKTNPAIAWCEFYYASAGGNVWYISNNKLVQYNWGSNTISSYNAPVDTGKEVVFQSEILPGDKRLWLRFKSGIVAFDVAKKEFAPLILHDPYDPYSVKYGAYPVLCDADNNLWLILFGDGFSFCNLNSFRLRHLLNKGATEKTGVSNFIRALATDMSGNIYFSSEGKGIALLDSNGDFKELLVKEPGYSYEVLCRDSYGKIWIGGKNVVVYDPAKKRIDKVLPQSLIRNQRVSTILQLQNGNFLIGTYGNLYLYDVVTKSVNEVPGIREKDQIFGFLYELPDKDILVGQRDRGIKRYTPLDNGYRFKQDIHPHLFVKSCLQVTAEEMWFATTIGLYSYNMSNGSLKPLSAINDKLPDLYLYSIMQDTKGYYWVSSNNGLFRWKGNDYKSLGYTEGVQSREFNTNAFCRSENGILYFGGVNGINKIETNVPQKFNEYNSRIQLLRLIAGDTTFLRAGNNGRYDSMKIPAGNSSLEVDYTAINFFQPGKYKVQYRLKNYNDNWQIADGMGTARFVNIKPGAYIFEIRLFNPDNLQGGDIHQMPVNFTPYWWQTSIFKLAMVFFSVLTVAAFSILLFRYRLRRERMQLEKQLAIQRERERIVSDLHDDIGATLSSMNIYSDLAGNIWEDKPGESKKLVDKISVASKELMGRMGDIIWSMKPSDQEKYTMEARLKNYCGELLTPKNIVCEFDIDAALDAAIINPEIRKNILLIAKEAINNIAKYSEAAKAVIVFKKENDIAVFSIQDNGRGFDNLQMKQGNGLANMEQRCKAIGGKIQVNSNAGNGVHIICHLPIANISYAG